MTAVTGPIELPASVAILAPFVAAGVFGPAEVHLAETVSRLRQRPSAGRLMLVTEPGAEPPVPGLLSAEEILALAVAARAPRLGHVGVELEGVAERIVERVDGIVELPWPDPDRWAEALERSELVARPGQAPAGPTRPLIWDGVRLYLHRYFAYEQAVANDLAQRVQAEPVAPLAGFDLDALFPPPAAGGIDRQRQAADVALRSPVSVIAGGPGTGKTRTIARLLAAALGAGTADNRTIRSFALAAPTGKAAARMTEAVHAAVAETRDAQIIDASVAERLGTAEATTIHRLLGARPGGTFAYDRHHPLTHDLVVVDETSMVALPLMARLLDAVRPGARVVFVGDPDQLASVEAGTVLADLVGPRDLAADGTPPRADGPLAGRVTILDRVHRFGATSGIAALADAVRRGDAEATHGLLDGSRSDLRLVDPSAADGVVEELVAAGIEQIDAARSGRIGDALAAASSAKVLAAVHRGANGRFDWQQRIERIVLDRVGDVDRRGAWYEGRPVLVTGNDRVNQVFNGDTGVAVRTAGGLQVAFPDRRVADGSRLVPPARLGDLDTWWSMTIHKSQGSEFPHVVVTLPTDGAAPVLTRELLYTAITRARERVTLVATADALAAAVARPVARASGLGTRLWT